MKGFGIYIKNDLLEPKHVQNMGEAYWLYTWLLDKMTSVSEEGVGKILGGKPIKYEEIKRDLGVSTRTYRRWVDKLREGGYINTIVAPYGLIITVNKATKIFGNSYAINGTPPPSSYAINGTPDVPEMAHLLDKNGTPNKTIQLDNTERQYKIIKSDDFSSVFLEKFNELYKKSYRSLDTRNKKLTIRLKTFTKEQILIALENMNKAEWTHGKNDRGWVATPDYLLENDKVIDKWLNFSAQNSDFNEKWQLSG